MTKRSSIRNILLASILGNAAICGLKIAGGVLSGSTVLLADGSDSLLNVASGTVAYAFRTKSEKPPDSKHHYGHSLLEVYGSLLILALMVFILSFIAFIAIDKLKHNLIEPIDPIGIPFAVASLVLNLAMLMLLRTFGRESTIASVEARHISLDVVEGILSLSGVSSGVYVSAMYDVAVTFVLLALVAFFVARTFHELRASILAESPSEEVIKVLESTLASVDGVRGIHNLRIRQAGKKIFADVHLEVDRRLTVKEAHRICDEAERMLKQKLSNIDIIIHIEPEGEERSQYA
ncbi:MAG: cation diffusion facilitator family transporter [Thaumarchaeota archaeon]|jgi:cation diffusion facilitator family transporter|nr:cation diffusion facilitator family transporter [Candidatus Terraquivivens yellowstonensis]